MNSTIDHNGNSALQAEPQRSLWFTPRFDFYENDDGYVLMGDLPGVEPQDLDVTFEKQELTIHAKVAQRHGGEDFIAEEYGVGDFHRSFSVGEQIEGSLIRAEFKNGVLVVELPKRPDAKPRKIGVRAE